MLAFLWRNLASIFLTLCSAYTLTFSLSEKLQKLPFLKIPQSAASTVDGVAFWSLLVLIIAANIKVWWSKNYLEAQNAMYKQIYSTEYSTAEDKINSLLRFIATKHLNFDNSQRVSVYKYDPKVHTFFRIGRFCKYSELMEGGKREFYDRNSGVIGKAWSSPQPLEIKKLPDPSVNLEGYKKALNDNNVLLPDETLNGIRMLSRSYFAFRTEENESHFNSIVLFESKKPKGLATRKIKKVLQSDVGKLLTQMISQARMPSQNNEEGL